MAKEIGLEEFKRIRLAHINGILCYAPYKLGSSKYVKHEYIENDFIEISYCCRTGACELKLYVDHRGQISLSKEEFDKNIVFSPPLLVGEGIYTPDFYSTAMALSVIYAKYINEKSSNYVLINADIENIKDLDKSIKHYVLSFELNGIKRTEFYHPLTRLFQKQKNNFDSPISINKLKIGDNFIYNRQDVRITDISVILEN